MAIVERIVSNGHGSLDPSYLVIHETANPGATALNHVAYWSRDDTYAVHYVGDWTGAVYHTVPDDRLCWHVGNGNAYTVGIELCHATNAEDFERVWRLGVAFAAGFLKSRGWGIDRLISHDDCRIRWGGTDHTDPLAYFRKYGRSWEQFKQEVAAEMEDNMTDADMRTLARYIAEAFMDYSVRNPENGFEADIKWRIANLGDKTQTMADCSKQIAQNTK